MAFLILENGDVYEGRRIGSRRDAVGELVFTTGMVGYLETITDPSYYGQIVIQTFPLMGNYGLIPEDFEGKPALFGYVCREICDTPSNFRSEGTLESFLVAEDIPGIAGVDTRELTRTLREYGVMNAMIADEIPSDLSILKGNAVVNAVPSVTCGEKAVYTPEGGFKYDVALLDYGAKENIVRSLVSRGCRVTRYPASTAADEILAADPDGIMLSNGPGDPAENVGCIAELRKLAGKKPIFGICLGHQLLALAMGGRTYKLKYGHRGGNQPVRDKKTGRTYITSQNHGYAVDSASLGGVGVLSFENANDLSCEGMDYPEIGAFTVQFHPEACSGPKDTSFLFDRFIAMMEGNYAQG